MTQIKSLPNHASHPAIEILSDESIRISSGKCSLTFHPDGHLIFQGKKITLQGEDILLEAKRIDLGA